MTWCSIHWIRLYDMFESFGIISELIFKISQQARLGSIYWGPWMSTTIFSVILALEIPCHGPKCMSNGHFHQMVVEERSNGSHNHKGLHFLSKFHGNLVCSYWESWDTATLNISISSVLPSILPSVFRREVETDPDSGFETSGCSQSELNNYNGPAQCGALSDPKGPFAACHATLPPKTYQEWVVCVFLPNLNMP